MIVRGLATIAAMSSAPSRLAPCSFALGVSLVLSVAGCDAPQPAASAGVGAEPAAAKPAAATSAPPAGAPEGGYTSAPPEVVAPPPWFTPEAFMHETIVRHDQRSNKLPTGQSSTMLVLELKADTTPEQCMHAARAKLGETITDLPGTTTTPQGYLNLQGKSGGYEYTVVCGLAKGTPTMFLSVTQ